MSKLTKKEARQRRHRRVRKKISGTAEIPRMSVCRTANHMYIQFIDDVEQRTLASAASLDPEFRKGNHKMNVEGATALGKLAAERAQAANINTVVFDRGGFRFHGRVKALAESAAKAGLKF